MEPHENRLAPDVRAAAIAAGQHGLITFGQARHIGLGRSQITRLVQTGRWERSWRGVYRILGAPATPTQRALAACLAGPDGSVVSHVTAAALHGLEVSAPPQPHLTVPYGRSVRLPRAIVHRARLTVADHEVIDGVPTTVVERTVIDCAGSLGPRRLQALVDDVLHRRLTTPDRLLRAWDLARLRPGRAGEVRLRAAVEPWHGPITPGSPAEVRLRRSLARWGFPEAEAQIQVRDGHGDVVARVDLGWRARRIGVEYDSVRWHGPSRWESDERRQAAIELLGWTILRADRSDLLPGATHFRDALTRVWRGPVS